MRDNVPISLQLFGDSSDSCLYLFVTCSQLKQLKNAGTDINLTYRFDGSGTKITLVCHDLEGFFDMHSSVAFLSYAKKTILTY